MNIQLPTRPARQGVFRSQILMAGFLLAMMKSGCEDLRIIEVSVSSNTTVPGNALGGLLGSLDFGDFTSVDLTESQEFENQGVAREDVNSVVLKTFRMSVVSPDDGDLSFLHTVAFYVESDGLERKRISHLESFPEGEQVVDFELDDQEIVEYVAAPSMSITVYVTADSPSVDTEIKVDAVFTVQASNEGACKAIQDSLAEDSD